MNEIIQREHEKNMAAAITRSYHVSMYEIKALACSTLSYEDQQNAYYITFRICNLAYSHGNTVLVKVVNDETF